MIRTQVGYMGGSTPDPTYRSLGNHSEAIRIDFDPTEISYETLLESFWAQHTPFHPAYSQQYRSAVFTCGSEQEQAAREVKALLEGQRGITLHTALEPAGMFYPAEDYHQKYNLQHQPDMMEILSGYFQAKKAVFASTSAARLNAYLGGSSSPAEVLQAAQEEGLPPGSIAALKQAIGWDGTD